MLNNENIVCVSNTTWEGFYTKSTVQILSLLARENTILFVEYPFTLKDVFTAVFRKGRAPVSRMLGLESRLILKKTDQGTTVHTLVVPPVLPVEFIKIEPLYKLLLKFNAHIYALSVRRALRKLNMERPVCINAYNAIYGDKLVGKLHEKLHLFYCYDGPDILRYGKRAIVANQSFAEKVDGLIVSSDFLADSMKDFNKEVSVVKNGVDFQMFHQMAKTECTSLGKRKKVGYIGSLDHRFDLDAIEYTVQKLADYDFEFVGDLMHIAIEQRLSKYPNVQFKPPVKPYEVPAIMAQCDLGLIPYLCTEFTKNIYPLKINEYLSVGVPVVLTSFAVLPEFTEIVTYTSTKESFCEAIAHETASDSLEKIEKRIAFAEKNSWENRAILFGDIINRLIERKP